jgi:hypothetical protein
MSRRFSFHGWWLVVISCVGCASDTTELPVAAGTVTHNGAPVEGAVVVFHPANSNAQQPSQATTNADGRFQMTTHVGQGEYKPGLAPGKYLVEIKKTELSGDFTRPPKNVLPEKYANPKTSNLSADIPPEGAEDLRFALE